MADVMVILIISVIVASSVFYMVRAKKRGQACIGCPGASQCGRHCHCDKSKEM